MIAASYRQQRFSSVHTLFSVIAAIVFGCAMSPQSAHAGLIVGDSPQFSIDVAPVGEPVPHLDIHVGAGTASKEPSTLPAQPEFPVPDKGPNQEELAYINAVIGHHNSRSTTTSSGAEWQLGTSWALNSLTGTVSARTFAVWVCRESGVIMPDSPSSRLMRPPRTFL